MRYLLRRLIRTSQKKMKLCKNTTMAAELPAILSVNLDLLAFWMTKLGEKVPTPQTVHQVGRLLVQDMSKVVTVLWLRKPLELGVAPVKLNPCQERNEDLLKMVNMHGISIYHAPLILYQSIQGRLLLRVKCPTGGLYLSGPASRAVQVLIRKLSARSSEELGILGNEILCMLVLWTNFKR